MGLSAGGLIRASKIKMAIETTAARDTTRQNEDLYLKKCEEKCILFVYLLIKKNLYLKSYLPGSKIGINAFMRVGLCEGGAYTWSNRSVKEKVGLSFGGGGGLIGGEIRYTNITALHLCL